MGFGLPRLLASLSSAPSGGQDSEPEFFHYFYLFNGGGGDFNGEGFKGKGGRVIEVGEV